MYLFIYVQTKRKPNKCLINSKMVRKIFFIFLISWEKINKSIQKRKSQKVKEISKMGSGGAEVKLGCK